MSVVSHPGVPNVFTSLACSNSRGHEFTNRYASPVPCRLIIAIACSVKFQKVPAFATHYGLTGLRFPFYGYRF